MNQICTPFYKSLFFWYKFYFTKRERNLAMRKNILIKGVMIGKEKSKSIGNLTYGLFKKEVDL